MKLLVVTNQPRGTGVLEVEADGYVIDPRIGSLTVSKVVDGQRHDLIVYAAGVWRSIADVGALRTAMKAAESPRESPDRGSKARPLKAV